MQLDYTNVTGTPVRTVPASSRLSGGWSTVRWADDTRSKLPRINCLAFLGSAHGCAAWWALRTGKMRNAVRAMLTKHPLVKGFDFAAPNEGGEGVTVVEMALS